MSRKIIVALAAGTVMLSTPLLAQPALLARPGREREDSHLRNDCRLAGQVIRTGHPAPRRQWALDAIRRCDESGPAVIADVWLTAAPGDQGKLRELFNVTRDFNDRRVVDAVATAAREASTPEVTRIFALALLFNYAVPGLYIDTDDLLDPGDTPPGLWGVTHDDRASETRAVLGDLRPVVSELLQSIIVREPQGRVGVAAAAILHATSQPLRTP